MAVPPPRGDAPADGQAGVSVVEIVVAMFLLALMSIAVLPLMIGSVQASATNRDVVAAGSLASARLALLQAAFPHSRATSCAEVTAQAATGLPDPSGSGATAAVSVGPCPASYPGAVLVKVAAYRPHSSDAAIVLDSAILVTSP